MDKKKKILSIGGGGGQSFLIKALSFLDSELTCLVPATDSGGSTGRLTRELNVLPMGDLRKCLVAGSKKPEKLKKILEYRFEKGSFKGHSLGNIILAAFEKNLGNLTVASEFFAEWLECSVRVLPITHQKGDLRLKLSDGKILKNEDEIYSYENTPNLKAIDFFTEPKLEISSQARNAIQAADIILIGPGNLFCSVLANLAIAGVADSLKKTKAKIILIANLTRKVDQIGVDNLSEYVNWVEKFIKEKCLDVILYSNSSVDAGIINSLKTRKEEIFELGNFIDDKRLHQADLGIYCKKTKETGDALSAFRAGATYDSLKLAEALRKIIK